MNNRWVNVCIRCGKERIHSKTWTEVVETFYGKSEILHEENVCPDKECQAIVDEKFAAAKKKTLEMQTEREERMKKAQNARRHKPAQ